MGEAAGVIGPPLTPVRTAISDNSNQETRVTARIDVNHAGIGAGRVGVRPGDKSRRRVYTSETAGDCVPCKERFS